MGAALFRFEVFTAASGSRAASQTLSFWSGSRETEKSLPLFCRNPDRLSLSEAAVRGRFQLTTTG